MRLGDYCGTWASEISCSVAPAARAAAPASAAASAASSSSISSNVGSTCPPTTHAWCRPLILTLPLREWEAHDHLPDTRSVKKSSQLVPLPFFLAAQE